MCKAFKDHMERGRREGRIEDIKKMMKNLNLSLDQVMKVLEISDEDKEKYSSAAI